MAGESVVEEAMDGDCVCVWRFREDEVMMIDGHNSQGKWIRLYIVITL